jgi:hypothetical protein
MVSTGWLHGFEWLEERSLLALDYTRMVEEILPQPFRLRFEVGTGEIREHFPDFLAVFRDGSRWLFDVRPAELVREEDTRRASPQRRRRRWRRGDGSARGAFVRLSA